MLVFCQSILIRCVRAIQRDKKWNGIHDPRSSWSQLCRKYLSCSRKAWPFQYLEIQDQGIFNQIINKKTGTIFCLHVRYDTKSKGEAPTNNVIDRPSYVVQTTCPRKIRDNDDIYQVLPDIMELPWVDLAQKLVSGSSKQDL